MKLIDSRFGRFVLRRWSSEEDMGFNLAITIPRKLSIFEREKIARLEAVDKAIRLQSALREVEFLKQELYTAREAAFGHQVALVIDKVDDLVEIVHLYQQSLKTLHAPDPHQARFRMVFADFYEQFKDDYEHRHDG